MTILFFPALRRENTNIFVLCNVMNPLDGRQDELHQFEAWIYSQIQFDWNMIIPAQFELLDRK